MEQCRTNITNDGAEAAARPAEIHRLFRIATTRYSQILYEAVGFTVRTGARNDWLNAE